MSFLKIFLFIVGVVAAVGFIGPMMVSSSTDAGPITVALVVIGLLSFGVSKLTKKEKKTDEKVS